jgi:hypothetical protein
MARRSTGGSGPYRGVSDHSRLLWQLMQLDRSLAHLGLA